MNRFGQFLSCSAAAAIVSIAQPAQAQTRSFDIPAQKATGGLQALGEQANVQLLSARRDTVGKRTNLVRGTMTATQALERLLAGTGLTARRTNERTFTVIPSRAVPITQNTTPLLRIASVQVQSQPVAATRQGDEAIQPSAPVAAEEGEVVVTGIRQSLRNALRTKRATEIISDNISSEEIGQLPDVTIAEELNRLPGVNTTRDRGNASQAAVRGMGPRFVFGLVNGREIASSEPGQEIRWEVYPSEVLSGVQVYKAQDSGIVPGGIAATIDIRTLRPLEYRGPTFNMRVGPTYNENGKDLPNYSPWGFRGSAGVVTHLTDNLAVAVAGSVQRSKNGFPDFRTWGWNTPSTQGPNTGDLNGDGQPDNTAWGLNTEIKNVVQDRFAVVGNVGWKPTDDLTINWDTLYSKYTIGEDQFQTWYGNNVLGNWGNFGSGTYNAPGASYDILNGTVVAADLPNSWANYQSVIAKYKEVHDLFATGANIAWKRGPLDVSVDLSHSRANRDNSWRAIYLGDQFGQNLDYELLGTPSASISGNEPWDPALQFVSPSRPGTVDGPEQTKDRISAVASTLKYSFDESFLRNVQFGGRYSDRLKSHRRNSYNLCPGSTTSGICDANSKSIDLTDYVTTYEIEAFDAPPMVIGNWDQLWDLVYPASDVPSGSEVMLQRTKVGLKSAEVFGKLSFGTDLGSIPLTGSFGVRIVQTKTKSSGFQQDPSGISPVTIRNKYTNALPTLNLTAHLAENQLLRFGAGIAISRPPLDALTTGFVLNTIEPNQQPTGGGGNPTLKPFKAHQVDLSYENYFHDESLFALALFYKDVKRFIGSGQVRQNIGGTEYLISTLTNADGGNVYGLETTFQTRFYFLPGLLQNFGIYANYAHVRSNIREFAPTNDPYLMVGVAKHTAQLDGFYGQGPFEARLSMKHHSPFTVAPTWVATQLKRLDAETMFDASVSYQLTKQVGLRFQARNLTNERSRSSEDNNRYNLANGGGYQVYGRSCLMDVSLKF